MALELKDLETELLVRELASRRGVAFDEAVRQAVSKDLAEEQRIAKKLAAMREILDEIDRIPRTGLVADKAFFDEMSGDED